MTYRQPIITQSAQKLRARRKAEEETRQAEFIAAQRRLNEQAVEQRRRAPKPPAGWKKPRYGTREYWQAVCEGRISELESQLDAKDFHERRGRALESAENRHIPKRHFKEAPKITRQYANHMSTEAARDQRLSMGAKACLQMIRALCGNNIDCQVNKWYLAQALGRSHRTIQRYIAELVKFNYIETSIFRTITGAYKGLHIFIQDKILPWWKTNTARIAEWLESTDFKDRTSLSHKNYSKKYSYKSTVELKSLTSTSIP